MRKECPLLRVDKKEDIKITWKGNEECFNKHLEDLQIALGHGSLSWKRESQKASYPLHVRYKPQYVPFDENLIFRKKTPETANDPSNDYAFLHIHFIYASSYEDYRHNARPMVSDWFARLNDAENPNWIIVFDSSRAKDKKVRSSISEKIRSDFARFLPKLLEINDTTMSDKSAFNSLIRSTFLSSLDFYSEYLSKCIQKTKESPNSDDFHPSLLINQQFKLCRFYWNLGLLENSLRELDDLDAFLSGLIWDSSSNTKTSSEPNQPLWLKKMKLLPFGQECSLLGSLLYKNYVYDDFPLVKWRGFLLAHQILITFHMFQQRLELMEREREEQMVAESDVKSEDSGSEAKKVSEEIGQQLRHNFISFILRYTHDCLMRVTEEVIVLQANYSPVLLHILGLMWHAEVFQFCDYLADVFEVETASYYICQMTYLQCNAALNLYPTFSSKEPNSNDRTIARRWLEAVPDIGLNQLPNAAILKRFSSLFCNAAEHSDVNDPESIHCFTESTFKRGVRIFRTFGWARHAELFNAKLANFLICHDKRAAYDCLIENIQGYLEGKCSSAPLLKMYAAQLLNEYSDFLEGMNDILLACYLTLFIAYPLEGHSWSKYKSKFLNDLQNLSKENRKIFKNNTRWKWPIQFPLSVHSLCSSPLMTVLNSSLTLNITLNSYFPFSIEKCLIRAILKPMCSDELQSANSTYCCITANETIARFTCISKGKPLPDSKKRSDIADTLDSAPIEEVNGNEHLILSLAPQEGIEGFTTLVPGLNAVELKGQAIIAGCFVLHWIEVVIQDSLTFVIDYQAEMGRTGRSRLLDNVLCLVDIKKPSCIMEKSKDSNVLLAGVVQSLRLRLNAGTAAIGHESQAKVSFVGIKPLMEFLTTNGVWDKEATITIPKLNPDEDHQLNIFLCLSIDRMNFSADQSQSLHYEVQVDWAGLTCHFPLTFLPILNIRTMTSLLGESVLFEVDIQRCDKNTKLKILPVDAKLLQDQSVAKDLVEARLLNALPLQAILANSSYRIVWQLPSSKIGKSIPITHYLQIHYRAEVEHEANDSYKINEDSMPGKEIMSRSYLFENKLSFAIHKVEYEVCAHILSERPQSVLCRIDLQCDLIVSLRSLTHKAESIIVAVEVDPQYWLAVDRFKVVNVKESGLAQTSFAIIPKKVGFLPYPALYIHRYINTDQNDRRSFSAEQTMFGERLTSFHRNQGKQIHVLGPLHDENGSMGSKEGGIKKSLKMQAKDRIQKLFE
ncbi:trafficking protein particle complex subunit 10, TRAPPC10 domain-containing protein [Ditylenchus destructor]|nr:trafficking protein particle complex subunit 10, TRAPPC10 domain-containing protein [Ditylenchus destructor]